MGKRNKLWLSMQAVTLAGITTLSACSLEGEGEASEGESAITQPATPEAASIAHGEGGEGGEGEGGEGEGGAAADPATDDIAYLTQLGLIRGHLLVGHQLYQEGHTELAQTHMKHPESELYAAIMPAFAARGAQGFAESLSALSEAVNNDAGTEAVNTAYQQVITDIADSEQKVADDSHSPANQLKLASELLKLAGEEYAMGIVDGEVIKVHEYQDAYGFTQIAKALVNDIATDNESARKTIDKAKGYLADLEGLWPTLVPIESVAGDASQLYGSAARIEILALGL